MNRVLWEPVFVDVTLYAVYALLSHLSPSVTSGAPGQAWLF
jgi:hypothetical protein